MGQRSVSGSPTGSPVAIETMLDLAVRHHITPQTKHFPMRQINEAFARLDTGKARYRIVLDRISDPLGLFLGTNVVIHMKGVVMRFLPSIFLTITLLVLSMGLFSEAEAKIVDAGHATVTWKGTGVIDDQGDGDMVFSGTITGIILVKHLPEGSEPAQIHKTKMDCQAILYINKNVEQRNTVLCILRAHEGKDIAYGEIRCAGKKTGECKGDMTWVRGKGGFKGITGTTPFVATIYIDKEKEGEIYGSAHWPNLTYTLP
jgi:hypothetical protein